MALSGSIETGYYSASDGTRTLVLEWSASQSGAADNYSNVSWVLRGGGTSKQGIKAKNIQAQIHTHHTGTLWTTATKLYNGTVIASGTVRVNHNADGTASFYTGISGYIYNYGANYEKTASQTWNLDTINRYFWTNINVLNPDDVEIPTSGAYFDVNWSDGDAWRDLTNEPTNPAIHKVYGSYMELYNIRPFAGYALEKVTGATPHGNNPNVYCKTITDSSEINIHLKYAYTKCGVPTNLSIIDNSDNTITISGTVGSDGIQNASTGIRIFGTYSEKTLTTSNYDFTFTLEGTTGTELKETYGPIMMNSLSGEYNPTIKIIAYTVGTVPGYDSDISSVISSEFKFYTQPSCPIILRPSVDMTHAPHDFTVLWEKPDNGINNPVAGYNLVMQQLEEPFDVYSFDFLSDPDILGCTVKTNKLDINHTYQFKLQALGTNPNFNSDIVTSSTLNIIELEPFSDLVFTPSSLDDIKFFENGDNYTNVLHISDEVKRQLLLIKWNAPEGINNIVKVFNAYLIDEDNNQLQYWQSPSNNRGFAISSEHISKDSIQSLYKEYRLKIDTLSIYTDEYQNYDNTSEFLFRVYPASGMYINTESGYKRAIGFKRLDDDSWIPLRELYHKLEDNQWVKSKINN